MPAPIALDIKSVLIKHLLMGTDPLVARVPGQRQAFVKTEMINGVMTKTSGVLPDAMGDMVEAMSDALNEIWKTWQAKQIVAPLTVVGGTVTNGPVAPPVYLP